MTTQNISKLLPTSLPKAGNAYGWIGRHKVETSLYITAGVAATVAIIAATILSGGLIAWIAGSIAFGAGITGAVVNVKHNQKDLLRAAVHDLQKIAKKVRRETEMQAEESDHAYPLVLKTEETKRKERLAAEVPTETLVAPPSSALARSTCGQACLNVVSVGLACVVVVEMIGLIYAVQNSCDWFLPRDHIQSCRFRNSQ
jgi:hypothetical protein